MIDKNELNDLSSNNNVCIDNDRFNRYFLKGTDWKRVTRDHILKNSLPHLPYLVITRLTMNDLSVYFSWKITLFYDSDVYIVFEIFQKKSQSPRVFFEIFQNSIISIRTFFIKIIDDHGKMIVLYLGSIKPRIEKVPHVLRFWKTHYQTCLI